MKVFKFGGASVKDAAAIRNLADIISKSDLPLIIVVSAFGKTTNALEEVVNSKYEGQGNPSLLLKKILDYHLSVIDGLGLKDDEMIRLLHGTYNKVNDYLLNNDAVDYDIMADKGGA